MLEINFNPFPVIITGRLILRQMNEDDLTDFFLLRSNEKVMAKLDKVPAKSVNEVKVLLGKITEAIANDTGIVWALCLKENNKLIGSVGFHNIYKDHYRAEIGYALFPDFQRKGIMKEVMPAMLEFGFNKLRFHSIEAKVNPVNEASIGLLESFGFVKEAHFKQSFYFKHGFLDTAIYSLLAKSYKDLVFS
jgi:ribosomal-protein-alanine N-acetyltransferase